jgi:hypothetical protein
MMVKGKLMTTLRKIESNGQNALQSTGPQTAEGKAKSAKNAMKHGLLSHDSLLPNENAEELAEFRQRLREEMQPVGELENLLLERIVSAAWRLRRLAKIEAGIFSWHRYTQSAKMVQRRADDDEISLPGGSLNPKNAERLEARTKVQQLKGLQARELPTYGPAFVRDASKCDAFSKLSRYEASIERSLYRALHELQRLQAARAGVNVPPPVAVDVEADIAASIEKVGLAEGDETNCAKRTQISPKRPPGYVDLD